MKVARIRPERQRGVATLIVVALLFLVLSLVAAYTNRNLIFEQRTSGNQYRSTQAFEAAEAGMEWALTMLNAGRIDAACQPSANPADTTFRQRYLSIDPANGVIDPAGILTASFESTVWPTCVFNGNDWTCNCPAAGVPAVAVPVGSGVFPAFRVRFARVSTTQPGVVRLQVNGCTRADATCLDFPAQAVAGEGRATVSTIIALRSALPAPPVAALTVKGDVTSAGILQAVNPDAGAGGLALLIGDDIGMNAPVTVAGPPGSPIGEARRDDVTLGGLLDDRLFTQVFSIWPDLYRDQPGAVVLDCDPSCDADAVRAAAQANPGRVLWAEGDVDLDAGGDVGAAGSPILLVVSDDDADGSVQVDVSVTFHGLLMVRDADWASAGAGVVRGAAIAEGDLTGTGSFTVVHDAAILNRLRWTTGSFVRVPGSWRDF